MPDTATICFPRKPKVECNQEMERIYGENMTIYVGEETKDEEK